MSSSRENGLVKFIGTMYLPDDDIRPVYKVLEDQFSIPMGFLCYVNWIQDDGKNMVCAFKFHQFEFTDDQLIPKMKEFLKPRWKERYGKTYE